MKDLTEGKPLSNVARIYRLESTIDELRADMRRLDKLFTHLMYQFHPEKSAELEKMYHESK